MSSLSGEDLSQVNDFDAELLSAAEEGAEQVEENVGWWDFKHVVWPEMRNGTQCDSDCQPNNSELHRWDPG